MEPNLCQEAVAVHKEKNIASLQIDPYCCAITITRVDKIGPVTVGHIPREISTFVYFFLHESSGKVISLAHFSSGPNL